MLPLVGGEKTPIQSPADGWLTPDQETVTHSPEWFSSAGDTEILMLASACEEKELAFSGAVSDGQTPLLSLVCCHRESREGLRRSGRPPALRHQIQCHKL